MGWHYRIVKTTYRETATPHVSYAIHEAFTDDAGKVWAITEDPVDVSGDTPEEVVKALEDMLADAETHSVLDRDRVPEPGAVNPMPDDDTERQEMPS